jgi:hypothetical protein
VGEEEWVGVLARVEQVDHGFGQGDQVGFRWGVLFL